MYREARRNLAKTSFLFLFILPILFSAGCAEGGKPQVSTVVEGIYPTGTIRSAKIIDQARQEKAVALQQQDLDYIVELIKQSAKQQDGSMNANNMAELNVTLTDSAIQLAKRDQSTLYYLFQSEKSGVICYKIQSEQLSTFLSILFDSFGAEEILGKKTTLLT
ncbi:hypothetical protein [Gorillibacterium massiliense]|uniref:hypothetical protein n=1 Tax=Gorillibacterium massiliense TaxID=1280390 RepID=UPI0004B65CC9|nr:hypothetical protein [Gorillibacterium massiliense]